MNRQKPILLSLILALLLAVGVPGVMAQDDAMEDATVVGDSESAALQAVRQFIEERNTDVIADDVTYVDRTLPEPIVGRDAYLQANVGLYGDTFADFFYAPSRYIVSDNTVVVEFEFRGTPTAAVETADTTTMNEAVAVPMVGIFDVQDGIIQRIDMFYDAAGLQYQLGYDPYYDPYYDTAYPGAAVDGTSAAASGLTGAVDLDVDDITEDPETYIGTDVIVQGSVGEALSDNTFLLIDDDLIDFQQEELLVVDASDNGLNFVQLGGASVLVAGTIETFVRTDVEADYGVTLDEAVFGPYEGLPVLYANRAVNLYDVATLENIVEDPAAFYGQTVSIRGDVVEMLSGEGFVMDDDDLIDLDPERILVVAPTASGDSTIVLPELDTSVVVTGTVREFIRQDFESEFGLTLDEGVYGGYEALPAIIADSITNY